MTGCPEFEALKKRNKGGLPDKYEGELEKFIKEKREAMGQAAKPLTSLQAELEPAAAAAAPSEYTETISARLRTTPAFAPW